MKCEHVEFFSKCEVCQELNSYLCFLDGTVLLLIKCILLASKELKCLLDPYFALPSLDSNYLIKIKTPWCSSLHSSLFLSRYSFFLFFHSFFFSMSPFLSFTFAIVTNSKSLIIFSTKEKKIIKKNFF